MGCKNTATNDFGPGKPDANLSIQDAGMARYGVPMPPLGTKKGSEPWMMNAAQNLVSFDGPNGSNVIM